MMLKVELELRNLTDLAFVSQDYETTIANTEFPIADFKRIKAYKHAAHAEEIQFFARMACDRTFLAGDLKDIVNTANAIYDLYGRTDNS
jgi:hypothetical protein